MPMQRRAHARPVHPPVAPQRRRHRSRATLAAFVLVALAACSDDDTSSDVSTDVSSDVSSEATAPAAATTEVTTPATATPDTATPDTAAPDTAAPDTAAPTTTAPEPLTILVTNDDGVAAPGIDALVTALGQIPDVTVVVYAPAENQSGSSDTTSASPPTATTATTASGFPAVAVAGTPADSIIHALDVDGIVPDLVVSGVNTGQNIGVFVPLSGTVGAARTAARRGIPAIAVSAGGLEGSDYATAAGIARDEVIARLDEVGPGENDEQVVVNLNVPTCATGTVVRGVLDVPPAETFPAGTNGLDLVFDCASTAAATTAVDDATAMVIGFASRSIVPADL